MPWKGCGPNLGTQEAREGNKKPPRLAFLRSWYGGLPLISHPKNCTPSHPSHCLPRLPPRNSSPPIRSKKFFFSFKFCSVVVVSTYNFDQINYEANISPLYSVVGCRRVGWSRARTHHRTCCRPREFFAVARWACLIYRVPFCIPHPPIFCGFRPHGSATTKLLCTPKLLCQPSSDCRPKSLP